MDTQAKQTKKETVIDGVKVVEDGDVTHFTIEDDPVEQKKAEERKNVVDTRSTWEKICDWWDGLRVKPYVKIRDFNKQGEDEFRIEDNPPATGAEIGIKISF